MQLSSQPRYIHRRVEHMQRMALDGHSNHFIREPQETKDMYDAVQAMHPKTLSACCIVATSTSKRNPNLIYQVFIAPSHPSRR